MSASPTRRKDRLFRGVPMDTEKRLDLIGEAVGYCQRVRAMGMPASCYAKALREPVHFLWERRMGRGQDACARFRSRASMNVERGRGQLAYDHAVPFRHLQAELLDLPSITRDSLRAALDRYAVIVLITHEEHARLSRAGLGNRMPPTWDGLDALARYQAAGIELVPNPSHPGEGMGMSATSAKSDA